MRALRVTVNRLPLWPTLFVASAVVAADLVILARTVS